MLINRGEAELRTTCDRKFNDSHYMEKNRQINNKLPNKYSQKL